MSSESGFTTGGKSMMSKGSNQSLALEVRLLCSVCQEDINHRAGVVWKRLVLSYVLQSIFFPILDQIRQSRLMI